jgi:hypothetical protein
VLTPAYRLRSSSALLPKDAPWVKSVRERVAAKPGFNPAQI